MLSCLIYAGKLTGLSTANSPDAMGAIAGQNTGMQPAKDILDRVQRRLDAVGKSADGASREAKSPDAIRNLKKRARSDLIGAGWTITTSRKIAKVLNSTVDWLLDGEGSEVAEPDIRSEDVAHTLPAPSPQRPQVPIKGYVGASGEGAYYKYSDETFDFVDAPVGSTQNTIAFEIRGASFGPLVRNWLVFFDDIRSPVTEDLIGQVCVVGLADDRILLKEIRRAPGGRYHLLSNSNEPPIENVEIEWAARVRDLRPRR